jgi:hypothetical protein
MEDSLGKRGSVRVGNQEGMGVFKGMTTLACTKQLKNIYGQLC